MKTAFHSASSRPCVVVGESTHEGKNYFDVVLFGDGPAVEHMKTIVETDLAFDPDPDANDNSALIARVAALESQLASLMGDFKPAPAAAPSSPAPTTTTPAAQ